MKIKLLISIFFVGLLLVFSNAEVQGLRGTTPIDEDNTVVEPYQMQEGIVLQKLSSATAIDTS